MSRQAALRSAPAAAALVAACYLPLLLTRPGLVGIDTKQYLVLDPGGYLARAVSMWDGQVGMGTVPHQQVGFLWPMGPFFWLFQSLGAPAWVTQRLWLGTLLLGAATGGILLARLLGLRGVAPWVAGVAYGFGPYVLHYAHRISVLLLPWAGLPWLLALTVLAVRRGGWRWPAVFALVATTVGSVNLTALVLVGIAPVVWLVLSAGPLRETTPVGAAKVALRIGVLTALVSVWWFVPLLVQARYGIDVLQYSETLDAVAKTSSAPEVLRSLGYWLLYGGDRIGPWIAPTGSYLQVPLLAVSFVVPGLALLAALAVRWRYRAALVTLATIGVVVAVGAFPWADPSPAGSFFQAAAEGSSVGLALRSSTRALPMTTLAFALFLAAGVAALARRTRWQGWAAAATVLVAVVVSFPALWQGRLVDPALARDEAVPAAWTEAAAWLEAPGRTGRAFEIPGSDFAFYRWGATWEPVSPGLTDRPVAFRELIPYGSYPTSDLLVAVDRQLQEGLLEPAALPTLARVLGAGDLLVRMDLQFERYRTPRPRLLWEELSRPITGLGEPVGFGEPVESVAVAVAPMIDELTLADPFGLPDPAPVVVLPVEQARGVVGTVDASRPLVVSGSGEGVVELASAGLLDPDGLFVYSASYAEDPEALQALLDRGADLVVSDSNRRRAQRWRTVREVSGYTERAGEEPVRPDPGDNRLPLFPGSTDDHRSVSLHEGGASVSATSYGNLVSYTPDDRAALAVDGDDTTAWRTAASADPRGERLRIDFDEARTVGTVRLVQPQKAAENRRLTSVRLWLDDQPGPVVELGPDSLAPSGQTVSLPDGPPVSRLEVELLDTDWPRPFLDGASPVGFAEVDVDGLVVTELVRPPVDLLQATAGSQLDHRLHVVLARQRSNPGEPVRSDEEVRIQRVLTLDAAREAGVAVTARLSAASQDDTIDRLLGVPPAEEGGITAWSSFRLPGAVESRALAAVDGDPATAWQHGMFRQDGAFVTVRVPQPVTVDRLDLQVLADGRHTVPTEIAVSVDGGAPVVVAVPPIADGDRPGTTVSVPVVLPTPLTGTEVTVTFTAVREVTSTDWFTRDQVTLPLGVVELGIPGVQAPPVPEALPGECRSDLLSVAGQPVPVRLEGTTADALARRAVTARPCEEGATVALPAGEVRVVGADGRAGGWDVDRVVLSSDRGGAALDPVALAAAEASPAAGPEVRVRDEGRTHLTVEVSGIDRPTWLVLGQSRNDGWEATVRSGGTVRGAALAQGYANGWELVPDDAATTMVVELTWTPQRFVVAGFGTSLLGALVCLGLALWPRRRPAADGASHPLPRWVGWWSAEGRSPSVARAAGWSAALAAATAVLVAPVAGLAAGFALLGAAFWRRGPAALGLAAAGVAAGVVGWMTVRQVLEDFPPDFGWPERFTAAHLPTLTALALLVAHVAAVALRTPAADPGEEAAPPGPAAVDPADPAAPIC